MSDNINTMNNLDKQLLASQLQIASSALPPEKNFNAVISALSNSAIVSGVSLDDYSFQVGEIASMSGQQTNIGTIDIPTIALLVSITGNINNVNQFLKEINEKFPLSEITKFDFMINSAVINIQFYQKPFTPNLFNPEKPIQKISDKNIQLINKISSWQTGSTIQDMSTSISSSEAIPLF